jgi:hypothetical protein
VKAPAVKAPAEQTKEAEPIDLPEGVKVVQLSNGVSATIKTF